MLKWKGSTLNQWTLHLLTLLIISAPANHHVKFITLFSMEKNNFWTFERHFGHVGRKTNIFERWTSCSKQTSSLSLRTKNLGSISRTLFLADRVFFSFFRVWLLLMFSFSIANIINFPTIYRIIRMVSLIKCLTKNNKQRTLILDLECD